MRKRPLGTQRRRWGIGALVVASIAVTGGMSTSAQNPERAPDPTDTQAGTVDAQPEFAGDYANGGLGATGGPDDPSSKPDFGPTGSNAAHAADVPGVKPALAPADAPLPVPVNRVGTSDADLASAVADGATARVIVMTKTQIGLEGQMSPAQVDAQHAAIDGALGALQASLQGTGSKKVSELDIIPSAVYEVKKAGMDALLANSNVASVTLDGQVEAQLDSSTAVIDSDLLNQAGVLGDGFDGSPVPRYEVGIIDSGVDNQHNAFTGRIVAQACFVSDTSAPTNCPNGLNDQIGGNAGDNCTHSTDCDHGTHVGGISAGAAYDDEHEGVARGAGIIAIDVASDSSTSTRWTAFFSDIDQALQHVFDLKNGGTRPNIVAINMSIGTAATFPDGATCDNVSASTTALMQQLRNINIAPVIAAGNSSSITQMSYPGCASTALAIGATNDADVPAGFSNSSPGLEWWAPGVSIEAPVPTGNNSGFKDGTSMAAPHVAGAFGLLSECVDGNGVPLTMNAKIGRLNATGVNVTRNGVTRKRINVLDAATGTVNNNDFASPENLPAGGNFNDFDFTVCSDTEPGEPGPFSLDNGIWYSWTPNATGVATISTEDGGGNVTTFDSTLSVYTGNTLGTLQVKAFDDDSGTGLRSLVTMGVNSGTTYRIKVDGFGASNGLLNLHLSTITPAPCQGVNATLVGGPLADNLVGTAGNDVIVSFAGDDVVNGGAGNDRICTNEGADSIGGGLGDDLVFAGPDSDHVNGDDGNDTLLGNAGGGDVNDVGDTINGGFGNDTLDGWVGNDNLQGGPNNDTLLGAAGIDVANYGSSGNAITANLTAGTATGAGSDTFNGVENLRGSSQNDNFTGDAGTNRLEGMGGNDSLNGRGGNDIIDGGTGVDAARFVSAPAAVTADLALGTANGDGADTLLNSENLVGSSHNDTLRGNGVKNVIQGAGGNDTIRGFNGNDDLRGLSGSDNIRGGNGPDVIRGGDGNDDLFGEDGNDRLFGEFGNDDLNGGADSDDCDGGPGAGDTRLACEVFSNIP